MFVLLKASNYTIEGDSKFFLSFNWLVVILQYYIMQLKEDLKLIQVDREGRLIRNLTMVVIG